MSLFKRKLNQSVTKCNMTYFTYSGEFVKDVFCCKDYQEKNSMCVGKQIFLYHIFITQACELSKD